MKTTTRTTLALFTACAALPAAGLFAQSPSPVGSATPSVSAPATTTTGAAAEAHEGPGMREIAKLTPEERQKLRAAHQAALKDPEVIAAEAHRADDKGDKKAYHAAVRAAMIKADPSVQPILDKMKEDRMAEHPHRKDLK